jgi:hypothetical protein
MGFRAKRQLGGKTTDIKKKMNHSKTEKMFLLKHFGEKESGVIWRDAGVMGVCLDHPKMVL